MMKLLKQIKDVIRIYRETRHALKEISSAYRAYAKHLDEYKTRYEAMGERGKTCVCGDVEIDWDMAADA